MVRTHQRYGTESSLIQDMDWKLAMKKESQVMKPTKGKALLSWSTSSTRHFLKATLSDPATSGIYHSLGLRNSTEPSYLPELYTESTSEDHRDRPDWFEGRLVIDINDLPRNVAIVWPSTMPDVNAIFVNALWWDSPTEWAFEFFTSFKWQVRKFGLDRTIIEPSSLLSPLFRESRTKR
jgi:hypothetical protein